MSNNYLWDKSGDEDAEIQRLENLLSEFSYQPRPLVMPVTPARKTLFALLRDYFDFRFVAVTAMALLALGFGLWYGLKPVTPNDQIVKKSVSPTPIVARDMTANSVAIKEIPTTNNDKRSTRSIRMNQPAPKPIRIKSNPEPKPDLSNDAEGELAREKVLYALQITREKLNLITSKLQSESD